MPLAVIHLPSLRGKPVVNQDSAHVHTQPSVATKRRLNHLLLLLHVQTRHLDQVLHVLSTVISYIAGLVLPFQLRWHHGLSALLHLVFHIVEDAIEVDWVQFDRHLDSRILLEVHEWLLTLLGVHHTSCTFDALALLHRDLLPVEDHKLYQTLDHDHAVVWLASYRIMDQGEVK